MLAKAVGDTGFRIVSGGTDNHLFMTDVFSKGITGKDGQNMLEAANITVNKNTIPFDTRSPMVASGIRLGTPAVPQKRVDEAATIRMLGVAPEARGHGVGEALMRVCIERARASGQRRVRLGTRTSMTAAHRLYARLGFRRDSEHDWSPAPGISLLAFVLDLGPEHDDASR